MTDALVINESSVERETWSDPVRGEVAFRTIFGAAVTTPEFTAGVTDLAPGGWLGDHRHEPAELYFVLEGEGVLTIDGRQRDVGAGTAVHIPGNSQHGVRNTGDGPMRFFYAFGVGSFHEVEYRFVDEE